MERARPSRASRNESAGGARLVEDLATLADDELAQLSDAELARALHMLAQDRRRVTAQLKRLDRAVERVSRELAARGHGG